MRIILSILFLLLDSIKHKISQSRIICFSKTKINYFLIVKNATNKVLKIATVCIVDMYI